MRAESDATFAVDVVDARISFVRESGVVTHLILQKGADQKARKVRRDSATWAPLS